MRVPREPLRSTSRRSSRSPTRSYPRTPPSSRPRTQFPSSRTRCRPESHHLELDYPGDRFPDQPCCPHAAFNGQPFTREDYQRKQFGGQHSGRDKAYISEWLDNVPSESDSDAETLLGSQDETTEEEDNRRKPNVVSHGLRKRDSNAGDARRAGRSSDEESHVSHDERKTRILGVSKHAFWLAAGCVIFIVLALIVFFFLRSKRNDD